MIGRHAQVHLFTITDQAAWLEFQLSRYDPMQLHVVDPYRVQLVLRTCFGRVFLLTVSVFRDGLWSPILIRNMERRLTFGTSTSLSSMPFLNLYRMSIGTKHDKTGFRCHTTSSPRT